MLDAFTRTYADRSYGDVTMIRHGGAVIGFAMSADRRIYYSVLDPTAGPADVDGWLPNPRELPFPREIATVGFGVADQTLLPLVKKGSTVPAAPTTTLAPDEIDPFLSSTARFTAAAPFQVVSDGTHLYLFRQSITAGPDVDRLVNDNLLVDQFVMVGPEVQLTREVRFQRSRSRTRPQTTKDSLGAEDLDHEPFITPTQLLAFVGPVHDGRFSALLVPTTVAEVSRWQFAVHNGRSGRIDLIGVERSAEGMFNTRGTEFLTCPDHPDTFSLTPGTCPAPALGDPTQTCGKEFVPVADRGGYAGAALAFQAEGDRIELSPGVDGPAALGTTFSVEAWLQVAPPPAGDAPDEPDDRMLVGAAGISPTDGPAVWIRQGTRVRTGFGDGTTWRETTTGDVLAPGTWQHLAVTCDGTRLRVYVDGELRHRGEPFTVATTDINLSPTRLVGAESAGFRGVLDELRLWTSARAGRDIRAGMRRRLTGLELTLAGYWRLDEGRGTTVRDQADTGATGTIVGAAWQTSTAPVGDTVGISRASFGIDGRQVVTGIASLLYHQQEDGLSGYSATAKPLKHSARVMLALGTADAAAQDGDGARHEIAVLDLGVGGDGKLAQLPADVPLVRKEATAAGGKPEDLLKQLAAADTEATNCRDQIADLSPLVQVLTADIAYLDQANASGGRPLASPPPSDVVDVVTALQTTYAAFINAQITINELNLLLADTRVAVFENFNYSGRGWYFGGGAHPYREIQAAGINDLISSMQIPTGIQVTAYRDDLGSASTVFRGNVNAIAPPWNDTISALSVEIDADRQAAANRAYADTTQAYLAAGDALRSRRVELNNQLTELLARLEDFGRRLSAAEADSRRLRAALTGDVTVRMPLVRVDPAGLTVAGAVLGFAATTATPLLFDSALARVSMYFRGPHGQLSVAHYDTHTDRIRFSLTADTGVVALSARSSDLSRPPDPDGPTDNLSVTVADGDRAGTGTVTITLTAESGPVVETWSKVPLDAARFADVINGTAAAPAPAGRVAAVPVDSQGRLALADGLLAALPAGALLLAAGRTMVVTADVDRGALAVPVDAVPADLPPDAVIVSVLYDYASHATSTAVPADLSGGSQLVTVRADGASGLVHVDPPVVIAPASTCQWFAATPGTALDLDGHTTRAVPAVDGDLTSFTSSGNVTVEAWVRPSDTLAPARLVSLATALPSGEQVSYALGLRSTSRAVALGLDGSHDWLELAGMAVASPGNALTVEAWVKPSDLSDLRTIVAQGTRVGAPEVTLRIGGGGYQFGAWDGHTDHFAVGPPRADDAGAWVHLAGVYDGTTWSLYRNGVIEATHPDPVGPAVGSGMWTIGAAAPGTERLLVGAVDEVRIWNRARTSFEVGRDAGVAVALESPGLLGAWRFTKGDGAAPVPAGSRLTRHGGPVAVPTALANLVAIAAVGDQRLETRDPFRAEQWTHFAFSFLQRYAAHVGRGGYLDCGNSDALDISADLTLELGLRLDDLSAPHGLISRGVLGGGSESDPPYDLSVDTGGHLAFTFQNTEHKAVSAFRSTVALTPGRFTKVAVTRKRNITTTVDTSDPKAPAVTVAVSHAIAMYVDGNPAGTFTYAVTSDSPDVGSSSGATLLGRAWPDGRQADLAGDLAEVRIWNVARDAADIGVDLKGRESGLVSWWRFAENAGSTVADDKSNSVASFHGSVTWVRTPDRTGSRLVLLRDGAPVPTRDAPAGTLPAGDPHFCVGARGGPQPTEFLQGQLDELRIWNTVRTTEQIQDNLFRGLTGEQESLVAYYTFDLHSDGTLLDSGPRANTLRPNGPVVLSTAPLSEDAPQVGNALLQTPTGRTAMIDSTPAVAEYADLQTDPSGAMSGVFKRCYAVVSDGQWQLVTGFKVGDMVTEWVGQAQFDPQLMGYIEGAPPVPSENLTVADSYTDASTVALTEASSTTYTYASSRDKGFDTSLEASLMFGAAGEDGVGLGFNHAVDKWAVMGGLKTSFENSLGWLDSATSAQGRAITRVSTMGLRGRREQTASHGKVGVRFVPDNTGYALVQSETADVFALRLRHTGSLIAYQMMPNPDIPKDWNIISFPINPRYSKQGTLDGKVGSEADDDYPNALDYSPDSSYFKPIEAYALKNSITREEEQLRTMFDQFDAGAKGRRQDGANFSDSDLAAGGMINRLPRLDKHNLVSTYVWTAAGGQFSEEEQSLDTRSETTGGSYAFKGMAGFDVKFVFMVGAPAAEFELTAMFGGHLNLTVTKGRDTSTTFGAAVTVAPESDLSGTWDGKPADRQPGKVDAYRFMTFYLEPKASNFDLFFNRVVDPIWLEQSSDPSAAALRGARQPTTRPPCWRVLHRVTFVSRILAPVATETCTVERAMQVLDIDSNYELIRTLEPFVRDKATSYAEFSTAVHAAVAMYLPDLVPHVQEILAFLVLYYGVTDAPALAAPEEDLTHLVPQPPSVQAGAAQTVDFPGPAALSGAVLDETYDASAFALQWSTVSGPGPAVFATEQSADTTVVFPAPGTYRLRLAATAVGRAPAHADTVVTVTPVKAATDPNAPAPPSDQQASTVDLREKVGSSQPGASGP